MNAFTQWITSEFWRLLDQPATLKVFNPDGSVQRSWGIMSKHTVAQCILIAHDHGYFKRYVSEISLLNGMLVRRWAK
jgi:hypothetical protein